MLCIVYSHGVQRVLLNREGAFVFRVTGAAALHEDHPEARSVQQPAGTGRHSSAERGDAIVAPEQRAGNMCCD